MDSISELGAESGREFREVEEEGEGEGASP